MQRGEQLNVTISGPVKGGKTTLALIIKECLSGHGLPVRLISRTGRDPEYQAGAETALYNARPLINIKDEDPSAVPVVTMARDGVTEADSTIKDLRELLEFYRVRVADLTRQLAAR